MKISHDRAKIWIFYFIVVFISIFVHELGHSLVAWIHGIKAIPTPAKEYPIDSVPTHLENYISAGGVIATLLVSIVGLILFMFKPSKINLIILSGTMASPLMYTIRFVLEGRGHGDTEFQQTQSVLGLSYSGHFLDWMFLLLSAIAILSWVIISKPKRKVIPTILIGLALTVVFIVVLQKVNNAIFDPIFAPSF